MFTLYISNTYICIRYTQYRELTLRSNAFFSMTAVCHEPSARFSSSSACRARLLFFSLAAVSFLRVCFIFSQVHPPPRRVTSRSIESRQRCHFRRLQWVSGFMWRFMPFATSEDERDVFRGEIFSRLPRWRVK